MVRFIRFFCVLLLMAFLVQCKEETNKDREIFFLLLYLNSLNTTATATGACSTPGTPTDPLFSNQWHLANNGTTTGAVSGEDAKGSAAWSEGCKGTGINVVTVDDGMDIDHEDLKANYDSSLSINFGLSGSAFYNFASCSGSSSLGCHGTSVSGIMAALDSNSIGLSGVAPRAKIGARNILVNATDANASRAMSENTTRVGVSNNSWGARDNTGKTAASGSSWRSGITSGSSAGRSGKGTLYFWAAGNGGTLLTTANAAGTVLSGSAPQDNSNHDGQANHHLTFAVAAIGNDGNRAAYSEEGANLLVSAHSQGTSGVAISTTDISSSGGYNTSGASPNFGNSNYTNTFNGTSAAAPLAAGVGALILERNNNLTLRDVRVILARSSRKNDSTDADWITNGGGLNFNHKYGFGAVDAGSALALAKSWTLIGTAVTSSTLTGSTTNSSILNNNATGALNTLVVSSSGIGKIEHVELTFNVTTGGTDDAGDLYVELISPSGTKARLAVPRFCRTSGGAIDFCNDFTAWTFGATTFMDEAANGTWQLRVADVCNKLVGGAGSSTYTCDASARYSVPGSSFAYTTIKNITNATHTLTSWSMIIRGRAN